MPTVGQRIKPREITGEALIAFNLALRERFERGFARSRKGNLWRTYEGKTVSVFRKGPDDYRWSVSVGEGATEFSRSWYATEEDAIALAEKLGVPE